jgi:hypothetical protein
MEQDKRIPEPIVEKARAKTVAKADLEIKVITNESEDKIKRVW